MKYILSILFFLLTIPAFGSYPAIDSFSGTGPLSTNWTNTSASGYVALTQSSGTVVPSASGAQGLATYTSITFAFNQYSRVTFYQSAAGGSSTGPCVRMSASGDGVCYLASDGAMYVLSNGAGLNGVSASCPVPSNGDVIEISVVDATYTCTDITTNTSASGTDYTYSSGNPGLLVDQRTTTTSLGQF